MTYRRKEHETLHDEMRGEYDQEIYRPIPDDLIQNRTGPGWSQASSPTAHPNDDQEHQEVCKRSVFSQPPGGLTGQGRRFRDSEEWKEVEDPVYIP